MFEKVWAIKSNPNPNDINLGYVDAVIKKIDGVFSPATINDFPSRGQVFIISGYDEYVDSKFEEGELFIIEPTESTRQTGDCQFVSHGNTCKKFEAKHEFCNILEGKVKKGNAFTILTYNRPRNAYYFVHDIEDHYFYGPFSGDYITAENGYEVTLEPIQNMSFIRANVSNYQVARIDPKALPNDAIIEIVRSRDINSHGDIAKFRFFSSCELLEKFPVDWHDFITDDALIKWANDVQESSNAKLGRKQRQEFIRKAKEIKTASPERIERLVKIADKLDYWDQKSSTLIEEFLSNNTESSQKAIEIFIQNNFSWVQERSKLLRDKLEKETEAQEANLESLTVEIEDAKEKLKQIREQQSTYKHDQRIEEASDELRNLIVQIENEKNKLSDIENERNKAIIELDNINEYQDIFEETKYLERKKKEISDGIDSLTRSKQLIEIQYLSNIENLRTEAAKILPFLEIFQSKNPENTNLKTKEFPEVILSQHQSGLEIIDSVHSYFEEIGRQITDTEISNYLTCIGQSFLTVFSGLPGVGKTSLVETLSEALGIKDRTTTIPVARGWTSQNDILGFDNPLSGTFEPSPTGLFEHLQALNEEGEQPNALSFVLLDEANLSPIEHYWSSFLTHCNTTSQKMLPISNSLGQLKISQKIRFLATINFDVTTEQLSPRLLDRVPIVSVQAPKAIEDLNYVPIVPDPISLEAFETAFGLPTNESQKLSSDEEELFRRVKACLEDDDPKFGNQTIVSARKELSTKRFIARSKEYITGNLFAMDLAVLQFILPMIEGYGEQYSARLDRLKDVVAPLPKTSRQLDRMIKIGRSKHFSFSYFA